jgi:hypothetical protein
VLCKGGGLTRWVSVAVPYNAITCSLVPDGRYLRPYTLLAMAKFQQTNCSSANLDQEQTEQIRPVPSEGKPVCITWVATVVVISVRYVT